MPIYPTSTKSKNYQALGIDEIANDIETAFTAINQLEQGGGSEYTETIVNISSAQILAMGTTPIELLPAAGAGKYYDIDKIIFEFNYVSTPYATVNTLSIFPPNWGVQIGEIFPDGLTEAQDMVAIYSANNNGSTGKVMPMYLNDSITLKTSDDIDPTLGDGTMRVKIYHKTITFGA